MMDSPLQRTLTQVHSTTEPARSAVATLGRDSRGGVLLEYVVVLTFAGVLVALALLSIGPKTVSNYSGQRAKLYQSDP